MFPIFIAMHSKSFFLLLLFISPSLVRGGSRNQSVIDSFRVWSDILVTVDKPWNFSPNKNTMLVFYALPNGNTTAQTMGRKPKPGDDWHFDIQHIAAQTRYVRKRLTKENIVVIYLENDDHSWPAWKQKHPDFRRLLPHLVDTLSSLFRSGETRICLNGHSGGGSFIFGYLAGVTQIPATIKRISFLDSNYGYDSSYYPKIRNWLLAGKENVLNVFAYNDSAALYNGKPIVSPTGGTWYRSHKMMEQIGTDFRLIKHETDSLQVFLSADHQLGFYFKKSTDRGIYHTQQVELNGFIHSLLMGTRWEERAYRYYGKRAYNDLIVD